MSDYKKHVALRNAHEIAKSDAYFSARPQIDSDDRRNVFKAGFERGFDAAAELETAQAQAVPDALQTALTVFDIGLGFALCHSDFASTREAVKKLQADFTEIRSMLTAAPTPAGSQQKVCHLPFEIMPDEMAALKRFYETTTDDGSYDIEKPMMKRLAEIGLIRHRSAGFYSATTFGLSVLNGEFDAKPQTANAAQDLWNQVLEGK